MPNDEENEEIYEEIKGFLQRLRGGENLKKLRSEFVYKVLIILGFWPRGKELVDPDRTLEEILERAPSSIRVGKRMLQ